MGRGLQRICWNIVIWMPHKIREEEHRRGKECQKHRQAKEILNGIIRMEWQRILRPLSINPQRVVRAKPVQSYQMQDHHTNNHKRQKEMQREEAVQGRIIH